MQMAVGMQADQIAVQLALCITRTSAALAGGAALFARASRQKENTARHLTSPVGVAAETGDYGGAFGWGASVLEGAAMLISAAKQTGKMPH